MFSLFWVSTTDFTYTFICIDRGSLASMAKYVMDFAFVFGILSFFVSLCALCTFSKVSYSNEGFHICMGIPKCCTFK